MNKICGNKDCDHAGVKQQPENFYPRRKFCKSCTNKIDGAKARAKYKERKEFLKMFAV